MHSDKASNWHLTQRLLALTWQYRTGCIRVLGAQLLALILGLSGIGFAGLGIDIMRHATNPAAPAPHWPWNISPPAEWSAMQTLFFVAVLVLGFAALRAVLQHLNILWVNDLVQARLVVNLRAQVYGKLQRLSFRFFDANASSSLINRVTGDVQSVRMFVDQVVIQSIVVAASLLTFAVYMINIHPGLTLACLAPTPLIWIFSTQFSHIVEPAYARNRDLNDTMIQRLVENIRGMRVIKSFAQEQNQIDKFYEANAVVRSQQHWIFWRISIFTPIIHGISLLPLVILLGYGGWLASHGQITIGTGLVSFAAILQQFANQISSLAGITNNMQQALRGAARVFEVLDAKLDIDTRADATALPHAKGHLRFEKVWFDHGRDPILQNIDFEIKPGQCVAIVGPTGAGKSALMSLLPRFYDPTNGRILLDGHDLRTLQLDDLRRNIGLVFQESFLFSTSVAANIAFGHPTASRAQIERAARIAAAHEFIMEMPQGYDTVLGESGAGLSGGQRQRLAIARALLLEPAILMLDDPTASVDPGTEQDIIDAMEGAMEGRTTFIVAHRPAALKRADLIIVLDRGRIVQVGSHDELMLQRGYYRDSVDQQMRALP